MTPLPGPPADTWNALALAAENIFATRTWCETWWQHFGEGDPVVLTDDDSAPRVVLPLFRSGGLLRQVRIVGTGPADQLGPACAPPDSGLAGELLSAHLQTSGAPWDVVVLHDVGADQPWHRDLATTEIRSEPSPVLTIGTDDWDAFLAERSSNFRQQTRRKERRLERDFEQVTYRRAEADTLETDLDTFFRLHALRWGPDAALCQGAMRRFQVDFAHRAAALGWLNLWFLELDGVPAATMLGFRFGHAEYYYQGGRDPAYDHVSAGSVLMAHAIRHAVVTGAREYRLLRGDEGYKSRWSDTEGSVHTLALSRGLRGAAAVRLARRRARS